MLHSVRLDNSVDWETALRLVDAAFLAREGRQLRDPEVTILQGTWLGLTYEQMAETSAYSLNYLMRDVGPKFWRLLSEVLDEKVGKTNIRVVLEKLYHSPLSRIEPSASKRLLTLREIPTASTQQWSQQNATVPDQIQPFSYFSSELLPNQELSEIVDASVFYGRAAELATLKQWVLENRCRLIGISGLSGMGKTILLRKLVSQIQNEFDAVIWCSMSHAPRLSEIAMTLPQAVGELEPDPVLKLLTAMRLQSCLLILDGVESILQPRQLAGHYREGYEDYGRLFQRICEGVHQSCLIVTGLENPREVARLEGENLPVRSLLLSGLSAREAYPILRVENLIAQEHWPTLCHYYRGHPSALKLIAKLIRDLLNGDVAAFLQHRSFVFEDIEDLLERSFERLSVLEKEILYWLASEGQPVSLTAIQTHIPLSIYPIELLDALESLKQRSLVETTYTEGQSLFTLQPIVMEYVVKRFIAQVGGGSATLGWKERRFATHEDSIELTPSSNTLVDLNQWFQNRFAPSWQPVEALFNASLNASSRLRSTFHLRGEAVIKRFKQITLGTSPNSPRVVLLVAINQEADQAVRVCVQAQPAQREIMLPADLKLALLDTSQTVLAEVKSQHHDNFIQLPYFRGRSQEQFSIQLTLNAISYIEAFVI
jgi:hypothetical protein